MKKLIAVCLSVLLLAGALCGCSVEPNSVFTLDDLEGKKIGVQKGTTGELFAKDVKDAKVDSYDKGSSAIQALKQGKVDCVIIDAQPAQVFVQKNSDLRILEEPFALEEYAICMAKGNTELKDKINAALKTLKENGTLDLISKNYIGEEKGEHPYVSPENLERPNGTLVMATNAEFEPYEYHDNGKIVGFDVDMAQAICDLLGMTLKIENMQFNSIIASVDSGKADIGVAGMTVTEDRLKNVDFSDPYTTSTQVIVVRKK